jgi:DNA-binding transcriptional ArsR family regulator
MSAGNERTVIKRPAPDRRAKRIAREEREQEEVRLARALGHPLRVSILECLNAKGPMAPVEVAKEIRAELSNVSYHFRVLAKGGLIEETRREHVRGSVKTTYRATAKALFGDPAWSSLSPSAKAGISAASFQVLARRVGEALAAGTFDSKDDRHLSISTIAADPKGWEEISELLASVFHRVSEVEAEVLARGDETMPMSIGLLGFQSPTMYE